MATIAANVIFIWTGTNGTIPSGWTRETTLDAKYPKGTANAVNPGGTGGALTHSHTTPNHNHAGGHVHTIPTSPVATGNTSRDPGTTHAPDGHTHASNPNTVNPTAALPNDTPSTGSDNHEPSYFTVVFIKSDGTPTGLPSNAVGLWNNSAGAPTNWNLCDGAAGRPDMRNRWAKGAAEAGDGGGTGGNMTHTHTIASHTHTGNFAHDHPAVTSAVTGAAANGGAGSGSTAATALIGHQHALTIGSQATDTITGSTDPVALSDHQPPHWVLAWIQNNAGALDFPDRVIGLWLGTLATIPTNWKLCDGANGTPDLRTLFVKGANTLVGIGGSGGSLTHGVTHTCTGHTHPVASHGHPVTAAAGLGSAINAGATVCSTTAHAHASWSNTGAASLTSGTGTPVPANYTDTQPPYVDVAFIQWQAPAAVSPGAFAKATNTIGAVS